MNGPNPIVEGKSQFSGSVGIVVESAYLEYILKVTVRGNTMANARFGLWVGSQFETHESPNLGRLFGVCLLDNTFTNCSEPIHMTNGVSYDRALPVPNAAPGENASVSSFYDRTYLPQYACDGSIATGGCSPRGAPGEIPWLQLDLGEARLLSRIEVGLRQDTD